mgnify:CR=1 FL=1
MMKDPKERFSETADAYGKYRPSYPPALVEWVLRTAGVLPPSWIGDVGCGTGISTRLFAERGFHVVGIDPNEQMLRLAAAHGGRFVRAEASATALREAGLGLVVSGQAFHWFDLATVMPELRRVLRPRGTVAAFWNRRASTPFLEEYERLLRTHSTEYGNIPGPRETIPRIKASSHVTDLREAEFENAQEFDLDGVIGRARSSSYVIHGVADLPAFERALAEAFGRHERGGKVTFAYRSVVVAWRLA